MVGAWQRLSMIEDKVLVWRFNRGDPAALCRIYEKYRLDERL
jgi:hypothetical protein